MKSITRKARMAFTACGLSLAFVGTAAPSAVAAPFGHVWINVHCGGGNVTGIAGAVDSTWSTAGDWGDNVIYPRVDLGRWNTFNGRAYCNRPWYRGGPGWVNIAYKQFRPTAWNQSFHFSG